MTPSLPLGPLVPDWCPPPRPSKVVLDGRYCRLEPLRVERHAADLFAANALDSQGDNWAYLPYGPFATLKDYQQWITATCSGDDPLFFAVVVNEVAVGVASYLRIDPGNGSIEVGHINYSPRLQRTVAATEAMYLLMKNAFALGYRRYEWKCNALNQPSRLAAQRLGLSFEGVFRQATVVKGRNRDTAWYAAIDSEWPALETAFSRWLDPANFNNQGEQRQPLSTLTAPLLHQYG